MSEPTAPAARGGAGPSGRGSARAPHPAPGAVHPSGRGSARTGRRLGRVSSWLGLGATAVAGAAIGLALVPDTTVGVGPLELALDVSPSLHSETAVDVPPVGRVVFDTHSAPLAVDAQIMGVDAAAARELIEDPVELQRLEQTATSALLGGAVRAALSEAAGAGIGAAVLVALVYRRTGRAGVAGATAAGVVLATAGLAGLTFEPSAVASPRFEGLLSEAPYLAQYSQQVMGDLDAYRKTLADFVGNVSVLYVAAEALPARPADGDLITVLHVSDIHLNPMAFDVTSTLVDQFGVDVVIDTGDIVSWGTPLESQLLEGIATVDAPYVFVTGNHDSAETARAVAAQPNAVVLQDEVVEVAGLEIAGIGDPRDIANDASSTTGFGAGKNAVEQRGIALGDTIDEWNAAHPGEQVDIALLHDPSRPSGLLGRVPLVLSGHMHSRSVETDVAGSGTMTMTLGSTGGALAGGGLMPLLEGGTPQDLEAALLYFAADGERAGELVAYDDVTMGGLGLVSVSMSRHQVDPDQQPEPTVPDEIPESVDDDAPDPVVPDPNAPDEGRAPRAGSESSPGSES